jgi:hypothetical protein
LISADARENPISVDSDEDHCIQTIVATTNAAAIPHVLMRPVINLLSSSKGN